MKCSGLLSGMVADRPHVVGGDGGDADEVVVGQSHRNADPVPGKPIPVRGYRLGFCLARKQSDGPCVRRRQRRDSVRIALSLLALSVLSMSYQMWSPWRHPWLYNLLEAYGWKAY